MIEFNNKAFADEFCSIVEKFDYIGEKIWGDASGQCFPVATYEITIKCEKIWCAVAEFCHTGTGEVNRNAIMIDFASENRNSASPIATVVFPYKFSRRFASRVYRQNNYYEIRSYGKFTVGRGSRKMSEFFDYMQKKYPELIFHDEKNKPYIKIYHYHEIMDKETFKEQTFSFLNLISDFKKNYR